MSNYWLVGASRNGKKEDKNFVEQGIWMLYCDKAKDPVQYERASQIKPNDRIAIKRLRGRGKTGIKIFHIGIVKGVILDTNRVICTVNWVATDLNRVIEDSRGAFASVHGSFKHDEWIEKVFCL